MLRSDIAVAYTDTDGNGQRADRRPPGAEQYYAEIDAQHHARPPADRANETVVMTADYSFLAFYPYYGFQGLTSHYANPLAQFKERSAAIEGWATLTKPDQFIDALDALPWAPPTVFLMRHGANDTYTLRLAVGRLSQPAQRPSLSGRAGLGALRRRPLGRVRRRARSCWRSGSDR